MITIFLISAADIIKFSIYLLLSVLFVFYKHIYRHYSEESFSTNFRKTAGVISQRKLLEFGYYGLFRSLASRD
jgi:uncharacterized membrane protein